MLGDACTTVSSASSVGSSGMAGSEEQPTTMSAASSAAGLEPMTPSMVTLLEDDTNE
jgi:hypothetical protein